MAHMCRKLRVGSSRFLRFGNAGLLAHYAAMDMRERIKAVIAARPELTVRGLSLAAGMSDSFLGKFLKGQTDSMTIRTAEKLAEAMGVDAQWLIFGEGDPDQATDLAAQIERLSDEHQRIIASLVDQFRRNGTTG